MNKDTFRGFVCGVLCLALTLTINSNFTQAGDSGLSAWDRLHTDLVNLTEAVNNSGGGGSGFGTFGGHKVVAGGYSNQTYSNGYYTNTINYTGSGIMRISARSGFVKAIPTFMYDTTVAIDNKQCGYLDTYITYGYGYGYSGFYTATQSASSYNTSAHNSNYAVYEIPFTTSISVNNTSSYSGTAFDYIVIQ